MNAVEIEEAISQLALQPFDAAEFPFAFLAAFGNKEVTLKRLRTGNNNASDVSGAAVISAILLRNNIHLAVCQAGAVGETLEALRTSPATSKAKAKFILATDGNQLEAEDLAGGTGDTIACAYADFPNDFGFFLPLAGISTIKEIKDNPIDVRATGRLNKLYVELLKENADWDTDARRADTNHFMARLIFCFFAEDTGIFHGENLFTRTIEQMTERDGSNVHQVMSEIFRAMDIRTADRARAEPRLPNYANGFPYVNGALFSGDASVPRFNRMARTYLSHAGNLNWKHINPDIFGSMIQAVADDEERGALGMHYTSVPNILKVLNPLFLDDLRAQLEMAGQDKRKLLALRRRVTRIRVFDPACGSGNFLVIAYKHMRAVEAEVNKRRSEGDLKSEIPLTNFRGIELRHFPAEIARLALIIAGFQCDELYRGQREALAEFLPLAKENWIICGNALRLDWLGVCPPTGMGVKLVADDLFGTPLDQVEIDFENEGGETYICGNPPYVGSNVKPPKGATKEQKEKLKKEAEARKADLKAVFEKRAGTFGTLDYVAGWFMKAVDYGQQTKSAIAFVATNSVCQGQQVPVLWPLIFVAGYEITFAHTSFKWKNLATNNAGVTVVIIGLSNNPAKPRKLFVSDAKGMTTAKDAENINAYLVPTRNVIVNPRSNPISAIGEMSFGSMANDGGYLLLDTDEAREAISRHSVPEKYIRPFFGSQEYIRGLERKCIWVRGDEYAGAAENDWLQARFERVKEKRATSERKTTKELADFPYRFGEVRQTGREIIIVVPSVSSESRQYLPVGYEPAGTIVSNLAFALCNAPLWNIALIASRLHLVWVATVCGKLKTDFRYSNTLGWNTFPVPLLTEKNKADLTACAEAILLAREAHFPRTIADLYDLNTMPENLRHAHEHNDEVLERIYIGRRFRNDTERLEKMFDLYTKMIAEAVRKAPGKTVAKGKKT